MGRKNRCSANDFLPLLTELEPFISPTHGVTVGYSRSPLRGSGQNVGPVAIGAQRAGRSVADFLDGINSALWTWWNFTLTIELNVWRQIVGEIDGFAIGLAFLQSEFLGGDINLTQIINARNVLNATMQRAIKKPT